MLFGVKGTHPPPGRDFPGYEKYRPTAAHPRRSDIIDEFIRVEHQRLWGYAEDEEDEADE